MIYLYRYFINNFKLFIKSFKKVNFFKTDKFFVKYYETYFKNRNSTLQKF